MKPILFLSFLIVFSLPVLAVKTKNCPEQINANYSNFGRNYVANYDIYLHVKSELDQLSWYMDDETVLKYDLKLESTQHGKCVYQAYDQDEKTSDIAVLYTYRGKDYLKTYSRDSAAGTEMQLINQVMAYTNAGVSVSSQTEIRTVVNMTALAAPENDVDASEVSIFSIIIGNAFLMVE